MPRRRPPSSRSLRIASVATLCGLLGPLWQLACGGDQAGLSVFEPEPEASTAPTPLSECPTAPPQAGASCTQPEGTTCQHGACGELLFICRQGTWRQSSVPQPALQCPLQAPRDGTSCPTCFPTSLLCGYGCGEDPVAAVHAGCMQNALGRNVWRVRARECPDAGEFDAGDPDADDGEPDASDDDEPAPPDPDAGEPDASEPDASDD